MKCAFALSLLVFAAFVPSPVQAESWAFYRDASHKCNLMYESRVFSRNETDAEDFRRFYGPNQDTYFRVIGLPNEEVLTPIKIRAEYIKKRTATDLVYERTKRDFLVLSGFRGQNIFYTKIAISPDHKNICVLHIFYPRTDKRAFDKIVTRMSRSFVAKN
jgi:hypothetical protein